MFSPMLRRNAPSLLRSTTQPIRLPLPSHRLLPSIMAAAIPTTTRPYHASPRLRNQSDRPPSERPPTNFADLDVLGNTPPPSTSVDVVQYDGFVLNSGITIAGGDGALLLNGEAFAWRPWLAREGEKRLVNEKGQFDIPAEALSVFDLLWPRPGTSHPTYYIKHSLDLETRG